MALIENNAKCAAQIAVELKKLQSDGQLGHQTEGGRGADKPKPVGIAKN